MGLPIPLDLGAFVRESFGGATNTAGVPILVVAGGAGDDVANVGATIDRSLLDYPDSCVATILGLMSLGAADTLLLAVEIQESSDGSSFDSAEVLQAATLAATGGGGGTDENFAVKFDIDLRSRKQFFRINFTPDLTAANTDTGFAVCHIATGGHSPTPHS